MVQSSDYRMNARAQGGEAEEKVQAITKLVMSIS